jgi:hypothetical protein
MLRIGVTGRPAPGEQITLTILYREGLVGLSEPCRDPDLDYTEDRVPLSGQSQRMLRSLGAGRCAMEEESSREPSSEQETVDDDEVMGDESSSERSLESSQTSSSDGPDDMDLDDLYALPPHLRRGPEQREQMLHAYTGRSFSSYQDDVEE